MTARIEHSPAAARPATAGEARPATRTAEARFERLRAPFSLRCGALLIDYTLPVAVIALFTLFARSTDANTKWFGVGLVTLGFVLGAALAVFNLFVLTVFTGRTAGKWVTDLRIERPAE